MKKFLFTINTNNNKPLASLILDKKFENYIEEIKNNISEGIELENLICEQNYTCALNIFNNLLSDLFINEEKIGLVQYYNINNKEYLDLNAKKIIVNNKMKEANKDSLAILTISNEYINFLNSSDEYDKYTFC